MTSKPDYTSAITEVIHIKAGKWKWALPVRGYLFSVTAEISAHWMTWPENIPRDEPMSFKISDARSLTGEFKIYHRIGYHQGGIIFPAPLPNFNTANPYFIQSVASTPDITLYITQCRLLSGA